MNYGGGGGGAAQAQLASFIVHPTVGPPCPDCAPPPGSVTEVIRCVSTDPGGNVWPLNTSMPGCEVIYNLTRPPLSCAPGPPGLGPAAAVNCSAMGWRFDGLTSILPLRDGKTVLMFGTVHNGNVGIATVNQRMYWYQYAGQYRDGKYVANGTAGPIVPLGYSYALRSEDGGATLQPDMINLDG